MNEPVQQEKKYDSDLPVTPLGLAWLWMAGQVQTRWSLWVCPPLYYEMLMS